MDPRLANAVVRASVTHVLRMGPIVASQPPTAGSGFIGESAGGAHIPGETLSRNLHPLAHMGATGATADTEFWEPSLSCCRDGCHHGLVFLSRCHGAQYARTRFLSL